ncbi:hypothetical protein IWQ62_002742 [Dispira parvispora]|uniref:N-acetyltransferase domain-containing protein n=1 Tax=Dispira parvispora TaxID=1520584 RepID=A0A9W8AS71_9FUNG|nr:hypothetical protein IWQ62_002742 [Dispira parvispora]
MTASEPLSLEDEYEMQAKWRNDDDKCTFIVLRRTDDPVEINIKNLDTMVGDVNLFFNSFDSPHECELEVMIAVANARNQGLGTEAIELMMCYGIITLQVQKYTAKILEKNTTSRRLLTDKFGFRETGYSKIFQEVSMELPVDELRCEWARNLDQRIRRYSYEPAAEIVPHQSSSGLE